MHYVHKNIVSLKCLCLESPMLTFKQFCFPKYITQVILRPWNCLVSESYLVSIVYLVSTCSEYMYVRIFIELKTLWWYIYFNFYLKLNLLK